MATNGTILGHAPTSRAREQPQGDEEATADLRLGEFDGVPTLSLSEARLLIGVVKNKRHTTGPKMQDTEILVKTEDYLEVFARFKRKENIAAVEKILESSGLERFERSQLGSLCCESAEEAKTLVPSIKDKISDDDLKEILDDMTKLRNFVE